MIKKVHTSKKHSTEYKELFNHTPSWFVRYGTIMTALVFILIVLSTGFITYPKVLSFPLVLTVDKVMVDRNYIATANIAKEKANYIRKNQKFTIKIQPDEYRKIQVINGQTNKILLLPDGTYQWIITINCTEISKKRIRLSSDLLISGTANIIIENKNILSGLFSLLF